MSFHLFSSIVSRFLKRVHNILFNIKTGLSSSTWLNRFFFLFKTWYIFFAKNLLWVMNFYICATSHDDSFLSCIFFLNLYTSHSSRDSSKVWYMNHIKTSWKCSISKTCFANFFARFTRMKKKTQINFSRRSEETNHATYYMYFLT